jgi:hypothetical protein
MVPFSKAVVAVLLPREHLPFIREWCLHHISDGWRVFLYDNTGSVASTRKTSSFYHGNPQQNRTDKRGNPYGEYTRDLSDADVQQELKREIAGLDVTVVAWQPEDTRGRIVHGQVEAYVDFIRNHGDRFSWAAFIDADEYLQAAPGYEWDNALRFLENKGYHRLRLDGVIYESRWDRDGQPRPLEALRCCGHQQGGYKNIVRPERTIMADIHWGWRMEGSNRFVSADPFQFHFKHYRAAEPVFLFDDHTPPGPKQESESLPIYRASEALLMPQPGVGHEDLPVGHWKISLELERFIHDELPAFLPGATSILELGPGLSTRGLCATFPQARLVSLEHDSSWLERIEAFLAPCGARVTLKLAPLHPYTRWYDICPDDLGEFDLLLVDGPPGNVAPMARARAIELAGNLTPGGMVLLDDTNRADERAMVDLWLDAGFELRAERRSLVLLQKSPQPLASEAEHACFHRAEATRQPTPSGHE